MSNKEIYKVLCEQRQLDVPLFLQYWWMEAVCRGKTWDVAVSKDGDKVKGVMPYLYGRKMGMLYIVQPQLTQYSGPCYFYPDGLTASQRLEFEKEVASDLIAQVERLRPAVFVQNFSPAVTNWLPFYWAGYEQTTRYTYRIADISDVGTVFDSFDVEKRQRKIRRYDGETTVRFDMSAADFATFHRRYWQSKGSHDVLDGGLIERVCSAATARGNGVIAALCDRDGRLLSARFVVYDAHCAYSLMSAHEPSLHKNGHSETLFWKLIQYLSPLTTSFDFEGSMDEGLEYFYRSFGASQIPYSRVSKYRFYMAKKLLH